MFYCVITSSGGSNLKEAFEQCAIAMFSYITDLSTVTMSYQTDIEVSGDDLKNLLYKYLDELLFLFCAEPFLIVKVKEKWKFDFSFKIFLLIKS